jgi:hypothetical protein
MFPAFSFSNNCEVKNPETGEVENIQYDIADWKHMDAETIIFAPVAYSPNKTDYDNADYVSPNGKQIFIIATGEETEIPLKFRHWLGTNKAGEDVLSGLINGTRISLTIGLLSMGIASLIGLVLGAMAGYFGDKKLEYGNEQELIILDKTKLNKIPDSIILLEWDKLRELLWTKNCVVAPYGFVKAVQRIASIKNREIFSGFAQNDVQEFPIFSP